MCTSFFLNYELFIKTYLVKVLQSYFLQTWSTFMNCSLKMIHMCLRIVYGPFLVFKIVTLKFVKLAWFYISLKTHICHYKS